MGKLFDSDVLKAVLMETKAESGSIGEVIVKIFCGVIDVSIHAPHAGRDGYYADGMWRCGMNSNVIAWMELPAPPEEEQS